MRSCAQALREGQLVTFPTIYNRADIRVSSESSEGAVALRKFLEYAKDGKLPDFGVASEREPDSDFEISVIKLLNQHGYEVSPQVGVAGYFIDIAVRHPDKPGEYILGVECDGATYHSSRSARDRDRLRDEVLIKRGWNIHRIWSTDWFKNRPRELNKLIQKLNTLRFYSAN